LQGVSANYRARFVYKRRFSFIDDGEASWTLRGRRGHNQPSKFPFTGHEPPKVYIDRIGRTDCCAYGSIHISVWLVCYQVLQTNSVKSCGRDSTCCSALPGLLVSLPSSCSMMLLEIRLSCPIYPKAVLLFLLGGSLLVLLIQPRSAIPVEASWISMEDW
jgi:hypothetical protein